MLIDSRVAPSKLYVLPGREFRQFFAGVGTVPRNVSLGVVEFPAGSGHPPHTHPIEEEIAFVLEGSGHMVSSDSDVSLIPGMAVFMPPGVEHALEASPDGPLRMFVLYSPPVVPGSHDAPSIAR
jgi:quercetin dioxygenase-like cupin family protein